MKVGIDAHTLGSQSSGNENYYLQLLRDLARIAPEEENYIIYFTGVRGLRKIPVAKHFRPKSIWPANPFIRIPISFPLEFRRERLDVFHAQFIIPPFSNCRTVTTIPDILFEEYPQFFTPFENFRSRMLIPWSARRADHIITVSEFSKGEIVRRYDIEPSKVTVIDEAPRDEFRVLNKDTCRQTISRKYGVQAPFLLYVGRIQARKNLLKTIEALSDLYAKGLEQVFVIVGKQDWQGEQVINRVKDLELEKKIIFTGYVDWDDLPIFYNAAELFLFPSICEGFGAPVLEAMACGTPVVTSCGSSLEEVSGGAAMLVDPHSVQSISHGIEKVLSDVQLQTSMNRQGLQRAAMFSGKRKAEQTLAVYRACCLN